MYRPKTPNLSTAIVVVVAAALTVFPAIAQTGMGPGHGRMMGGPGMKHDCPMMGMMGPGREAQFEQRLATLKQKLAITPAQETAWTVYVAAAQKNVEGHQGLHRAMMQSMEAKTPVERLDSQIMAAETHAGLLKAMKPVLGTLYEALTADQKTKADAALSSRGCMM